MISNKMEELTVEIAEKELYRNSMKKKLRRMRLMEEEEKTRERVKVSKAKGKEINIKNKRLEQDIKLSEIRLQLRDLAREEKYEEMIVLKRLKQKHKLIIKKCDAELELEYLCKDMKRAIEDEDYEKLITMRSEKNDLIEKVQRIGKMVESWTDNDDNDGIAEADYEKRNDMDENDQIESTVDNYSKTEELTVKGEENDAMPKFVMFKIEEDDDEEKEK